MEVSCVMGVPPIIHFDGIIHETNQNLGYFMEPTWAYSTLSWIDMITAVP